MADDRTDSKTLEAATRIAAAGTGGALSLLGGVPGAMLGAAGVQLAVEATGFIWDAVLDARQRRASVPIAYVAATTDQSVDEITERLLAHSELLGLATSVITSAAETSLDAKLIALGEVLRNAVEDEALLDLSIMIADALRVIEAPHLKVLAYLRRVREGGQSAVVNVYRVHADLPELGLGVRPILSSLATKALVLEQIDYGEQPGNPRTYAMAAAPVQVSILRHNWGITDFGLELLDRLEQRASTEPGQAEDDARSSEGQVPGFLGGA